MRRGILGPDDLDTLLGARLRGIRKEQGKTLYQVGNFIGVSFDSVSLMERGRQGIVVPRLILWCLFLKVDAGELLRLALADVAAREAAHE